MMDSFGGCMASQRLPLFVLIICASTFAIAQSRGGGGSRGGGTTSHVDAATDARNAAVLGTGNNGDLNVSHPTSVDNEPRVEFRSQTVLIQIPVVVTDKSGKHLHGLSKEDFTVVENGKPIAVSNFEELTASTAQIAVPSVVNGQFHNLTLDGPQPHNVVVIALDTVNTPFLDQAYGRRELVKFLAHNVDSGQVLALMLITSQGLKVVQGLSGDPAHLVQALNKAAGEVSPLETLSPEAQMSVTAGPPPGLADSKNPGPDNALPGADPVLKGLDWFIQRGDAVEAQFSQDNAIETTMNAFLGIAWSLSGVPGRKSLIWATGGFPFTLDSPSSVPGGYLSLLYERTMLALNDSQVSVYPVDIRGLLNSSPFID